MDRKRKKLQYFMANQKQKPQYIKDGLVLYLDGIENTRSGHSSNTTVWEDLSGNNFDYNMTNCVVLENGFSFNGSSSYGVSQTANFGTNTHYTVEIIAFVNRAYQQMIFNAGANNSAPFSIGYAGTLGHFVSCKTKAPVYGVGLNPKALVSIQYQNNGVLGVRKNNSNAVLLDYNNLSITNPYSQIGTRTGGSYNAWLLGSIFAIRVYNRLLTDEERQHNYELDIKRFGI